MSEYTPGIDLSHHRPNFNIALAKQHGVKFVITKATEVWTGEKWLDPWFVKYRNRTKNNGLPFGAFMYWRAGQDPEEQVDWFFENVKKSIDIPPMIDVERTNNVGVMSKADAHQSVLECAILLEDIYNLSPLLYTSWWAWESICGSGPLAGLFPIWVANYTNAFQPLLPYPAKEWEFWQFTSTYPLPGQPNTCDANRFNGNQSTFDEYVKVSRSIMYPEIPPPPAEPKPIELVLDGTRYIGEVHAVND